MKPVLNAMEKTLVTVPPVLKVISKQIAKMDVSQMEKVMNQLKL
jgi:hypothetical protein